MPVDSDRLKFMNTTLIARKTAETARARAIEIDRTIRAADSDLEEERRACVALWNEFCAQESARLADKRDLFAMAKTYRALGWV